MHVNHDTTSCQLIFANAKSKAHILRTRLNFESSTTRARLAKDLTERFPLKDFDWPEGIEYIAEKTMRELEHGEPVVTVNSNDDIGELEYLIHPLVPTGKPTVIFGDPGAGKSQLAVIMGMVVSLPWQGNPLRLEPPEDPVKVLFLDYEADIDDIKRQLKKFTDGMGLGYCSLEYRRCSLPIADDIEGIRNYIDDLKIGCLIIDSVSLAAGGDLNKMDMATSYFRALRQLNITSVSLAHTSKDRESKTRTILGSVLFEAGARSVWELRANEGDDCLDMALFHRKANLSKKYHDIGFRINYMPNGNSVEYLNPKSVPDFLERMSVNQRILELLKCGKLSTEQIVEQLEIKRSIVDTSISRLRKSGKVVGISSSWGLAYQEPSL